MAGVAELLFLPIEEDNPETLTLDEEEEADDLAFPRWSSPPQSTLVCREIRRNVEASDSGGFAPVFSPPTDGPSLAGIRRHIPASDSDSESNYLDDQVALALDLFDRRSPLPPRRYRGGGVGDTQMDPFSESLDPYGFGVDDGREVVGSDYLELGLALGFGLERRLNEEDCGGVGDNLVEGSDWGGDGDGDGYFVGWRCVVPQSSGERQRSHAAGDREGLRILGFDSDSDSEDEHLEAMSPVSFVGEEPDQIGGDLCLPLCWDCFRVEDDSRDLNEEFEWEEVDGRVEENVVEEQSMVREESHLVFGEVEEDGLDRDVEEEDRRMFQLIREIGEHVEDGEDDEGVIREIDWEVLLAVNSLDMTVPVEQDDDSYLGDDHEDYVYTSEYEVLFGQFADHDSFIKGSPPAAKSVVECLLSVVLTKEDVVNNNTLCAVCKDEISLEESAKRLPCLHHYHGECIFPWLRIRNTCPVCRHELPTDDPDYENWRARRAENDGAAQV